MTVSVFVRLFYFRQRTACQRIAEFFLRLLIIVLLFQAVACSQGKGYHLETGYQDVKPYPYKASFHNHSAYHPEYTHAAEPPAKRLKDYRDYDTTPPYGVVGISDHERITTPSNTIPQESVNWGVDQILWIAGNETVIGDRQEGGIFGDMVVINIPTEETDEPDWIITKTDEAQSGWVYRSDETPASIRLTFFGTGLKWVACKTPEGGIVSIFLDGQKAGEVNLHSNVMVYRQDVFSVGNLQDGKHELFLTYERKGDSASKYMGTMNVDRLIVFKKDGSEIHYDANHPDLIYRPAKYRYTDHPNGKGREVERAFQALTEAGCFMVLAHPNARLETKGEHAGKQLWTSAGYTYDELDAIFGNAGKGVPPLNYQPQALEIGNRGYDFSERTGYRNAEEKWDYLLSQGHRIMGFASDDTHGDVSFEGWVVIFTHAETREELSAEDVMESLQAGNYYASQGPNMNIRVEGLTILVETDKPALIEFISKGKVIAQKEDALEAVWPVRGDEGYVRVRVTRRDSQWREVGGGIGNRRSAWSNPIYVMANQ